MEAPQKVTLYKTEVTLYHGDKFTEVDKTALIGQVGLYGEQALVKVFWIECNQKIVSKGELVEAKGGAQA